VKIAAICIAVGKVSFVDVVVGVDRRLAADGGTRELDGAVGDHLVDVHVRLRAGAGLPDIERKLAVELALDHLVADAGDEIGHPARQQAELGIDPRRRLLDVAIGMRDGERHAIVADGEVDQRALRLGAPIMLARNLDDAHRIGLAPHARLAGADREVEDARRLLVLVLVGRHDRLLINRSYR
jgi:hypothetical protein